MISGVHTQSVVTATQFTKCRCSFKLCHQQRLFITPVREILVCLRVFLRWFSLACFFAPRVLGGTLSLASNCTLFGRVPCCYPRATERPRLSAAQALWRTFCTTNIKTQIAACCWITATRWHNHPLIGRTAARCTIPSVTKLNFVPSGQADETGKNFHFGHEIPVNRRILS